MPAEHRWLCIRFVLSVLLLWTVVATVVVPFGLAITILPLCLALGRGFLFSILWLAVTFSCVWLAVMVLFLSVPAVAFPVLLFLFLWFVGRGLAKFFGNGNLWYILFYEVLDLLEENLVLFRNECYGASCGSCTCSTADAVYVVVAVAWNIVIYDNAYVVNVYSSRKDVGRYNYVNLVALVKVHYLVAFALAQVTVHLADIESLLLEHNRDVLYL